MTTPRLPILLLLLLSVFASPAAAQTVPLTVESADENFVLREVVGHRSTRVYTPNGHAYGYSEVTTPLCASPCRLDALPGYHLVNITVGGRTYGNWHFQLDHPSALVARRHSRLGRRIFRTILGLVLTTAGSLALAHGLLMPRNDDAFTTEGKLWTSVGGVAAAIGLTLTLTAPLAWDRWSVTVTPDR